MLFYKKMLKNIAERVKKKLITEWALRMHLRLKSAKKRKLNFFCLFFFFFPIKL